MATSKKFSLHAPQDWRAKVGYSRSPRSVGLLIGVLSLASCSGASEIDQSTTGMNGVTEQSSRVNDARVGGRRNIGEPISNIYVRINIGEDENRFSVLTEKFQRDFAGLGIQLHYGEGSCEKGVLVNLVKKDPDGSYYTLTCRDGRGFIRSGLNVREDSESLLERILRDHLLRLS